MFRLTDTQIKSSSMLRYVNMTMTCSVHQETLFWASIILGSAEQILSADSRRRLKELPPPTVEPTHAERRQKQHAPSTRVFPIPAKMHIIIIPITEI
jgi:hypothetical protein